MSNKNIFLLSIGFILITMFIYSYIADFNLSNVATDSGFDTSYDSGGSSSSSSSDWSSSSSDGSGDGDVFGIVENLSMGLFFLIFVLNIKFERKKTKFILVALIVILAISRLLLLIFVLASTVLPIIAMPIWGVSSYISNKRIEKKRKEMSKDPAIKELLEEGYQIFYEVQMAWMNFDYDKLRELTTDVLYNTYYNQLQPLALKGHRNVMSDFKLIEYVILDKKKINGVNTITMRLNVKFYDFIVDSTDKVVRGNKRRKVNMTYQLKFVYDENAITSCPSCDAPLSSESTICEYCNTHIQSVRGKMKLSNKKVLSQK